MNEFGQAQSHPDTWEFIAHMLLVHGSFTIDMEYQDDTFTILFSLPHMPFTAKSYLYGVVIDHGLVLCTQTQTPYYTTCLAGNDSQEILEELKHNLQQIAFYLQ